MPVVSEVLSGNTSDVIWNPKAALAMRNFFDQTGVRDTLFVSDCALISIAGLKDLARKHIRFISRMPETFALAEDLKGRVFT